MIYMVVETFFHLKAYIGHSFIIYEMRILFLGPTSHNDWKSGMR